MEQNKNREIILTSLFVGCLLIANIIGGKLWIIGSIAVPSAIIAYPITYLITDILGQNYGKRAANNAVRAGLLTQILALGLLIIADRLPGVEPAVTNYHNVIGQTPIFIIASLTSYVVSQTLDVQIFHRIKEHFEAKGSQSVKVKWIWNNTATITSQLFDTVIYIGIAFGIGLQMPLNELISLAAAQYAVKVIFALLDTPIFYLFTRKEGKMTC